MSIVEAPDNETAAAFSLELGVRAGVHVATLPAILVARLESAPNVSSAAAGIQPEAPLEQLMAQGEAGATGGRIA